MAEGKKNKKVILNFCGSYASRMCTDSVSSQEISFMFHADVLIITVKLFWPWTDTSKALGVGLFMVPLATFSLKITQHFIPKMTAFPFGRRYMRKCVLCCHSQTVSGRWSKFFAMFIPTATAALAAIIANGRQRCCSCGELGWISQTPVC